MDLDSVSTIINQMVQVIIITSLPTVGLGLVIGLLIAILQAVTQVQEQTLTFVPKMIAVFLVLAASFPWMFRVIMEMTLDMWTNIPTFSR